MKKLFALFFLTFLVGCDLSGPSGPSYSGPDKSRISDNMKPVSFSALPDWDNDDQRYALQAFRNSCKGRINYNAPIAPDKNRFDAVCRNLPSPSISASGAREWFQDNFKPYKVYLDNGGTKGTFTGYYSPEIKICAQKTEVCNEPLMAVPTDGRNFKNVPKKTIVNNKIGRVLYWANIVDVQNIQIQGSGVGRLANGKAVKLNFAAVNDMPFKSIGDQLRNRGIRPEGGFTSEAVWQHLRKNPSLAREVIYNNPRYIYFSEAESHDVIGSMGVPLSKIRSIAMDDSIYALGLPVYINTNLSDGRKFRRLMIGQDRGEAIKGFIRADIFFGSGDEAYRYAHGQHSQGEFYILMPK